MSQDGTTTRRHNHGTFYRHIVPSARLIFREEGLRAFYRGAAVATCGSVASWGSYFFVYDTLRTALQVQPNASDRTPYRRAGGVLTSSVMDFPTDVVTSVGASFTTAVLTTPIWLVKTRMQVEDCATAQTLVAGRSNHAKGRVYTSFLTGLRTAIRTDGVLSLWRGLGTQLLMSAPNALYVPVYAQLKHQWIAGTSEGQSSSSSGDLSPSGVMVCSAVSKTLIAVISSPLLLIRTRLQDVRSRPDSSGQFMPRGVGVGAVRYHSAMDVVLHIVRHEGIVRGFFRGAPLSVALTVPRTVLHMMAMEKLLTLF